MAVDFARRPYTTDCRFHKDSDQVVKIRWYPALPEAGTLPFPSAISSLDWSSHPWVEGGIGEVFNVPRPFNAAKSLPYAKDLLPCEPAETFLDGEVLNEGADPQLYNEDGFPLCCLNLAAPKGGLEWGGTAPSWNPGPSCPTAQEFQLGEEVFWFLPAGASQYWFVTVEASTGYRAQVFVPAAATNQSNWFVYTSTDCTNFTLRQWHTGNQGPIDVTFTTGLSDNRVMVILGSSEAIGLPFSFRVDPA